jgi:hypothetical protein
MSASLLRREPGSRGTSAGVINVTENTGLCVVVSCEIDDKDNQRGRKLRIRCRTAPSEDIEEFVRAAVICYACRSVL